MANFDPFAAILLVTQFIVLLTFHYLHLDHDIHLHAVALFVVSVAVTGVGTARKLYFLDVAPKDQRIQGAAAVKAICRLVGVIVSTILAAIAHMHEVASAILFIVLLCLWSAYSCYRIVTPTKKAPAQV